MFSVVGLPRRGTKVSLGRSKEYTGVCRPDQEGEDMPGRGDSRGKGTGAYSSMASTDNTR